MTNADASSIARFRSREGNDRCRPALRPAVVLLVPLAQPAGGTIGHGAGRGIDLPTRRLLWQRVELAYEVLCDLQPDAIVPPFVKLQRRCEPLPASREGGLRVRRRDPL